MTGGAWLTIALALIAALGGIGGTVAAVYGTRVSRQLGVHGNEVQARADESQAADRLVGRYHELLEAERVRADRGERRADAATLRAQRAESYVVLLLARWPVDGGTPPAWPSIESDPDATVGA